MPQPVGFDAVDRNERGLVELPAYETHGLIWVVPSPQADDIDMAAWLTPFDEQFSDLDLGGHVVFEKWALHRNMSWRLALEGFQESYHFCSAHRESACSNYLDNQSVWADYGPHVRHSVPLPSLVDLREVPEGEWEYRRHFMTQNFVFPGQLCAGDDRPRLCPHDHSDRSGYVCVPVHDARA